MVACVVVFLVGVVGLVGVVAVVVHAVRVDMSLVALGVPVDIAVIVAISELC